MPARLTEESVRHNFVAPIVADRVGVPFVFALAAALSVVGLALLVVLVHEPRRVRRPAI